MWRFLIPVAAVPRAANARMVSDLNIPAPQVSNTGVVDPPTGTGNIPAPQAPPTGIAAQRQTDFLRNCLLTSGPADRIGVIVSGPGMRRRSLPRPDIQQTTEGGFPPQDLFSMFVPRPEGAELEQEWDRAREILREHARDPQPYSQVSGLTKIN